jgi:gliding motility-associated-like protein
MQVTIPAGITITSFIVEDSYFADALSTPAALMRHGTMELSTACGTVTFSCQGTASDSSGTCYLVPNTDVKTDLACCFSPSCTDQTFYITHGLSRDTYGPGCNQNYIYYSPFSTWPFSAFIVGKTVETTQTQWSVFPATICSDSCTIYLKATTKYGVPPYTITHPWATGASQFGSFSGCNSIGTDTITLVIPGCPSTCGTNPTLIIPAPTIVDACGDSVSGLTSKTIIINPVPVATATVREVCAGAPFTIPVSSCVTGSSYTWTGDNGSNGVGNISDVAQTNVTSPTLINYSIIPTANGCVGAAISVSADINPLPILIASPNDTIDPGISVPLNATGGLTYSWTPTTALSCATCANPIAAPVVSTTYIVTGNNEYECSSSDTLTLIVNQGTEVLYIPNSFTPNSNDLNDLFCVYGTSIKKIDLEIFDRWGELLFKTTDITMGWDGTFHGKPVEKGVYVYSIRCEWESGTHTYRTGTVTIVP